MTAAKLARLSTVMLPRSQESPARLASDHREDVAAIGVAAAPAPVELPPSFLGDGTASEVCEPYIAGF